MAKQKKSTSESYRPITINVYTAVLKNTTAKLSLGDAVHTDLFFILHSMNSKKQKISFAMQEISMK